MMRMNEFQKLKNTISNQTNGSQRKVKIDSCLEVFFGYSFEGNLRLSFMSTIVPPPIESTSILHVVQGKENRNTYWTSIDLLKQELKEAYYSFCENMIETVAGCTNEREALALLKRRFATWKELFKRSIKKSSDREKLYGIFGELKVLKEIIAPQYGMSAAIQAWGGPELQSKDFTILNTWYEIKTIGTNTDLIHVPSLAQLSSENEGHLVIVRVEAVSTEFCGNDSSLIDVIKSIILQIKEESIEKLFVQKLLGIGIDIYEDDLRDRFDVKSMISYKVGPGFPRITEKDIPYSEIVNVKYTISVPAISRFAEG